MNVVLMALAWIAAAVAALYAASIITWRLKWAVLARKAELPLVLLGRHDDWWPFLRWVPRRLTAFVCGRGDPVQLLGTNPKGHHPDVPADGTWCLSWPIHLAAKTRTGIFGLGIRRDYIDRYWTMRISLRT